MNVIIVFIIVICIIWWLDSFFLEFFQIEEFSSNLTVAWFRHVHEYVSSRCGKSTQPIRFKFCTEVWLFCVNHNLSPGCVIRVRKIQFHKKIDLEQNASIIAQYRSDRSELKIVRLN